MTKEECYKILNIKANSTQEQVNHSYKRMLKKYHPDTFQGDKKYATEKTTQIISAYNFLMENADFARSTKNVKQENKKETLKKQSKNQQKTAKEAVKCEKIKQKTADKKVQKPKFPIMAIDGDVVAIIILSIILVALLIIFALV